MTSTAPPEWAVGDDADLPRAGAPEVFQDDDAAGLVRFSVAWWTRALAADPLTGSVAERRRIRGCVAAVLAEPPGGAQLVALDALLGAVHSESAESAESAGAAGAAGVGLSSREWTEVCAATQRCESYLYALHLTCVAGLDTAKLAEDPARVAAKDTRRHAPQELAAALRVASGTATSMVGLSRQLVDLPAAEDALLRGVMSPPQFRELATVCRRLPEGPLGARARAQVEAAAVTAAATLSRARMAAVLEEAALAADPGYQARAMSQGIDARDVQLRRSPKAGCQRVVADLETADAARVWQVINQIAANAKDGDTYADPTREADADGDDGGAGDEVSEQERRTRAQMRADVLVSLVTGDFSPTPQLIAEALGEPVPAESTTDTDTDDTAEQATDDDDEADEADEADGADGDGGAPAQARVSGLVPDTRKPVRIPSPEQRAHLAEIHVVVFADDLANDDEDPDDPDDPEGSAGDEPDGPDHGPDHGPPDGPEGGPDDGTPPPAPSDAHSTRSTDHHPGTPPPGSSASSPAPTADLPHVSAPPERDPGRERPRPTTAHPSPHPTGRPTAPPVPAPRRASTPRTPPPAPTSPDSNPAFGAGAGAAPTAARLRATRRARAARRALAGYGPFGHVPGLGRLAPDITRAAIRAARWRRLVADPATGVLLHRSRWTLPAPDTHAHGTRSTSEHLDHLLDQSAAPDPHDPATRTEVTYRPSVLLAQHVRARDAGCISPVCHHPARGGATQLDHTTAWGPHTPTRLRGGLTEAGNLGCICQGWHTAKTHGGWDLTQPTPGSFVWTSPAGRVYHRAATPLLPDLADLLHRRQGR